MVNKSKFDFIVWKNLVGTIKERLDFNWKMCHYRKMSEPKPKSRGGHWKRPPTKVYDYNYDVGAHYYKPMLSHLDKKKAGVETELPGPKTFAERLATDPLYGKKKDVNYV